MPSHRERTHLFGHDAGSVSHSHAFNSSSDTAVDLSGGDLKGDVVDGGETGRALTVEREDGGSDREAGCVMYLSVGYR